MKNLAAYLLTGVLLAGCETSPAWYMAHSEKKTVERGRWSISVVPRGENRFDAFPGDIIMSTDGAVEFKVAQISAIEEVSGCKVTAAEYMLGTPILQAVVACQSAKAPKS